MVSLGWDTSVFLFPPLPCQTWPVSACRLCLFPTQVFCPQANIAIRKRFRFDASPVCTPHPQQRPPAHLFPHSASWVNPRQPSRRP